MKSFFFGLIIGAVGVVGGYWAYQHGYFDTKLAPDTSKTVAPEPQKLASAPVTKKKPFEWSFKVLGTDQMTGETTSKVTVISNNTGKSYDAGIYSGSCFVIEGSAWKLLEGESTGAICWFGGGGTEIGIFEEGGKSVVKTGVIEEATAETAGIRGNLKKLIGVE